MQATEPFTVVVLKSDNTVGHRLRTYDTYPQALGYLLHNLDKRPQLDLVDRNGRFVEWEFLPGVVEMPRRKREAIKDVTTDTEQRIIHAALLHYAESFGVTEATALAGKLVSA